jgi:hypothetical protein
MMIFLSAAAVPIVCLAIAFAIAALPARLRMERRARSLVAQYPRAERTSVYLQLHSARAPSKQREVDAKVAEMRERGWTFLRSAEASPLRTIRSWGGGLTLHFIRIDSASALLYSLTDRPARGGT